MASSESMSAISASAAYEGDRAADAAREIVARGDPVPLDNVSPDDGLVSSIPSSGVVAILGDQALPTLALEVLDRTACRVVCFASDAPTGDLMVQIFALYGLADRARIIVDMAGQTIGPFDAIVASALVGVSATEIRVKSLALGGVFGGAKRGAPLIIDDPVGLGALFYPPLDVARMTGLTITRHDPAAKDGHVPLCSKLILKSR